MKSRGGPLSGSSGLIPVPWTVAAFAALSASIVTLWGYGDTCHYDFVFDDYPNTYHKQKIYENDKVVCQM